MGEVPLDVGGQTTDLQCLEINVPTDQSVSNAL